MKYLQESRLIVSKFTLLIVLATVILIGCEEDSMFPEDMTEVLTVSAFDHFTSVATGTSYSDSSRWLIAGNRKTNTALVSRSFFIHIEKSVLRRTDFPITVQPTELLIQQHHWTDDPGGGPSRIDTYNSNVSFIISDIKADRVRASFSASTSFGESITGEINWAPLNFMCPIGGQLPSCPFDPSVFKVNVFSWTSFGDDPLSVHPQRDLKSVWASFTLPVDTADLKDHFVVLENGQTKVPGRYVTRFFRVDFFPSVPWKSKTSYTAKIIHGMGNSYNEKVIQQDQTLELKTTCGNTPVFENKLFVSGTSVEVGGTTREAGAWVVVNGVGGSFEDARKCPTIFHGTQGVIYKLQWVPDNGCAPSKVLVDLRPLFTDYDGNKYHETRIGNQIWMGENLRATYDAAGKPIREVKTTKNIAVNGLHYPWYIAVNQEDVFSQSRVQGICPNGWHLPTQAEFQELIDYASTDGRRLDLVLKDTATWQGEYVDWLPGFDAFNFRAVRAGAFEYPWQSPPSWDRTMFWSKDRRPMTDNAYGLGLTPDAAAIGNFDIGTGASIRCIKD